MSDVKYKILNVLEIEARQARCLEESLDFITLKPLGKATKQVFHAELGQFVFLNKA